MTPSVTSRLQSLTASNGRVLVTAPGFDVDGDDTGTLLVQSGLTINHAGPEGNRRPEQVAELADDAVAAIASSDPFTSAVFDASPDLRVIARLGVGTDSIDLEAATRAGVVVTTTPGLNDETCADHALALLLAATRRIIENDVSVRRGNWDRGGGLTPWDLHGKKVGVVGYGRIGRQVIRRLAGFNTQIRAFDANVTVPADLDCPSLDELLRWADIVTLHVPLTEETRGLIGSKELTAMKNSAILVNVSRGGVVDEAALLSSLNNHTISGAAMDVFRDEPPAPDAWGQLPNVVLSPHIGGLSVEAVQAMSRQCVRQILDVLAGLTPEGVVNSEVLNRLALRPVGGRDRDE